MADEEKVQAESEPEGEVVDEAPVEEELVAEEAEAEEAVEESAETAEAESGETAEEEAAEPEEEKIEEPVIEKGPTGAEKAAIYMQKFFRDDHPEFKPGDTVKVHYKIIEGNKERIQVFEGVVIAIKHAGLDKTFTVRKVSWNVGVERTFFYNSQKIDKIQIARRGRVRRAKIYYLRDRVGKAARIKELRKPKAGKQG